MTGLLAAAAPTLALVVALIVHGRSQRAAIHALSIALTRAQADSARHQDAARHERQVLLTRIQAPETAVAIHAAELATDDAPKHVPFDDDAAFNQAAGR